MKLILRRTGGLGGMRKEWKLHAKHLSPKKFSEFNNLLTETRFFKLPSEVKTKNKTRDTFWYELTVEDSNRRHSVSRCESSASGSFQKCVQWILKQAKK